MLVCEIKYDRRSSHIILCVIDGEEGNDAFGRQFGVPAFEIL